VRAKKQRLGMAVTVLWSDAMVLTSSRQDKAAERLTGDYAASVVSTSLTQYEVPKTMASSLKL
jgi:hypothetical protein